MIVTTFGIISISLCWTVIDLPAKRIAFIKNKAPVVKYGFGSTYQTEASRHPEPKKSAGMKIDIEN